MKLSTFIKGAQAQGCTVTSINAALHYISKGTNTRVPIVCRHGKLEHSSIKAIAKKIGLNLEMLENPQAVEAANRKRQLLLAR
ncbi:MAG: hypothetical protein AB7G80_09800 [Dongiaceae bacterium]